MRGREPDSETLLRDGKPTCCTLPATASLRFTGYRFAWNDDCDPDSLEVDWKRPRSRILRRVIKTERRLKSIQAGARMTAKEKQAYRLELARVDYAYKTAQERLDTNDNCKWVDLSYVEDSQGRRIYIMEMADAVVSEDEDLDAVVERHEEIWSWKHGTLSIFGPFRSVEEAEEWMARKGAFDEA